jgi:hypothetical protein
MRGKLTAGERNALGLWAAWYLERHSRPATAGDRAAIEARAGWHLRELVSELRTVARSRDREIEIPDPLFFRDLLEALVSLEVSPSDFFAGVMRRWCGGASSHGSN